MMRWIIGSSLKFRRLIVAVAAGIMVFGLVQLRRTPVDVLPEFSPVQVEVQTEALGLSAAEVEQLITVPLEQDLLNGVAFLDDIESASLPGLSSIVMAFKPGTPPLDARQVVQERLTQAHALPQVSKPPQMLQPLSSTSRVSMVRLSSKKLTPIEVSVLARWVIVPRLLGVDGVANVSIWGQRERQLQVQVDPNRLNGQGVSLAEVVATTGNALEVSPLTFLEASSPGTGGFIENLNQRLQIFHEQTINTPGELAQVPIEDSEGKPATVDGRPLTLGEVSTVVEDHQPLIGDALCLEGPCNLLVIEKFPGANTVEVTRNVEAALQDMKPGLGDLELDTSIYRPAGFTESAFGNLNRALLIGGILALAVLVLLLRRWRPIVVAIASIGVAVTAAGVVLQLRHATVNLVVMAGLVMALGALVADGISAVFNRDRTGEQDGRTRSGWSTVVEESIEMRRSAFVAGLVAAAAMIPFFYMGGEAGAFLPPIATSYLLAIAVSMVVTLTLTPALSVMLLPKTTPERRDPTPRLERRYEASAVGRVGRAGRAVFVGVALLAAGLATVPFLDTSLRPALGERDVLVGVEAEPGISLPKMRDLVAEAVQEIGALDGVHNVAAHVGRAILSDQRVNVNSGEIWVSLVPGAPKATLGQIRSVMDRYEGIDDTVQTYSDQRIGDVLQTNQDDVVVRVYGEDAAVRNDKAEQIRGVLAGIKGIDEPEVQQPRVEPTVEVKVDLARAQAVGLKPGDVRRTATTLISGITVGNLFEEQKVFDVVVWGAPGIRRSVEDLQNLPIEAPDGRLVRLGDVADVQVTPNPTAILHHSVSNYLDVTAAVTGRPVDAVTAEVQAAVRQVDFPLEHHAEVLGGYAALQGSEGRVLVASIAAGIAILLLLQAAFSSWRLAVLTMVVLPIGLVGSLIATAVSGETVTLATVAGLVAVLGITVRHLVMLFGRYERLRKEGMPLGPELAIRGTVEVLRPIVATTIAIAALQLPFAFAGGGGLEMIRPMALAILGGLATSVVTTLLVAPALYVRFGLTADPDTTGDDLVVIKLPDLDQAARTPGGTA